MVSDVIEKWREWKRNHPEFPLTAAPCGQWCKKIRGKTHYFGPLHNPDNAAENWARDKDYLLAGMDPPAASAKTTVEDLHEMFLADIDDRIAGGKISRKTRADYPPLLEVFMSAGVLTYPISVIGPEQFAEVQRVIERSGRTLRTQKNVMTSIKAMFNWAVSMEYIAGPMRYGPRFTPPKGDAIEVEQETKSASRFIDRETILKAVKSAGQSVKVAILLGINCAFYPGDTIAITLDDIDLDSDIPNHDFRRVKNSRQRAAALWPETVQAIRTYISDDRKTTIEDERHLILSAIGRPYTKASQGRAISDEFVKLIGDSHVDGVSLGSLRHTYATVIDQHPDQSIIDLTMGHAGHGMRRRVYKQLNLNELSRLRDAANVVRQWLYGDTVNEEEKSEAGSQRRDNQPDPAQNG